MKKKAGPSEDQPAWKSEVDALMRGVAGAFLFGAPFLYTMEMWWKGNFTSPPRMALTLMLAYGSLLALDSAAGFRSEQSRTWIRVMADSAEALAIALLVAALSLMLIGVIGVDDGLEAITGRIIMEALPLSIGVGIANHFLRRLDEGDDKSDGDAGDAARHQWHDHSWKGTLADMGATALGATILAAAIAPTDEIPMIASGLTHPWLLSLIAASVLLSYLIVFEAEFGSQQARKSQPGIFQSPITETLISYLISLLMAAVMLWLFQLLRPGDPLNQWISYIIVLGFPATIGGAAGRLTV